MLNIQEYVRPQSLEEAYELVQNRKNIIVGGMLWLKMMNRSVEKAIDLCDLHLDTIEEDDEQFTIGAMVTLRQLETHAGLNAYTHDAMRHSVEHIIGVQFRNCATVGGSIFGRYGFSDVLSMFMGLDAYVELYNGGIVPIREFAWMRPSLDILVRVIVKKTPIKVCYKSQRNVSTDFPVLTCCASYMNDTYSVVIGGRPLKAIAYEKQMELNDVSIEAFIEEVSSEIKLGSNNLGSAEYRQKLVKVLMRRSLKELEAQ